MFLSLLQRRNAPLLEAAVHLHQAGVLPPNTYAIDLDAVERNSAAVAAEANRLGLRAFAMTKQLGRNPDASQAILAGGLTHSVGVDIDCTIAAATGGLAAGHMGHLVQIPRHRAAEASALQPLYWTVFSEQKAREAGAAAVTDGRVQDVLLRVVADGDRFYTGHEGGVRADDAVETARRIDVIPGVRFAGITTFPATLFDEDTHDATSTPNLGTLTRVRRELEAAGFRDVEVNAPGTTSTATLQRLAEAGATQVEPGHGLTGTTPLHAARDLVEDPAIAYISEVSHLWNDRAYVFGGGLYVDPVLGAAQTDALIVGEGRIPANVEPLRVEMPAAEAIDYYATIPVNADQAREGDTVVFGFRPQIFVTRALTAGIRGISSGEPELAGIWSSDGSAPLNVTDAIEGVRSAR